MRYQFDGDLRESGGGLQGRPVGGIRYESGPTGSPALRAGTVHFDESARILGGGGARTVSLWLLDSGDGEGWAALHCRTFLQGFELYRGVREDSLVVCLGAGHPTNGPGACTGGLPFCSRVWHHLILRFAARGGALDVFVDGELVRSVAPEEPAPSFETFRAVGDLAIGIAAGDGRGTRTTYLLDDLRVYDQALDPASIFAVTTCPVP